MKHQNINVIENSIKITLNIGRQGEYNVRDIKFDMSDFQQKYGDGTATIVHYPTNGSAYTVPSIAGDSKDSAVLDGNNIFTWTIGRLATMHDGYGVAEITWLTADGLKKSIWYDTYCKESIGDYGADRAAQQTYIDQMVELASTITDLSVGFSDAEKIAAEISDARSNAVSDIEALKNNAVSAVNTAKSESIEDIGDSKESALNALNTAKQTALTDIESAKQDAETDINAEILIAETHANNASQSATNASNSATSASNSADSADQSAASAQTSATNASNSAVSASQFADNASSSANSASQSATSAQASATNASASEQNARQSAEDAQDILDSVQAEGNTQIGRVQAKGDEIIESLPDDFTQVQNDITALNGSLGTLKADLGYYNIFNGMAPGFIPTSGTDYPTTNASYPNAKYVIVDLLAGQALKIAGFASANTAGRARCIINGEIVSTVSGNTTNYTTTVNLSASINNGTITALKDIQIALMFLDGIVPSGVTATIDGFSSVSEMLFDTYNKTFSLEDSVDTLSDDLDDVETDLEALAVKTFDVRDLQYLVPNIPNITKASGYSVSAGATSVQIDANANYDSYWCITDKPLTLYAVPTAGQYYALGVLTGARGTWEEHTSYKIIRGTAGARYRLSDNNLPTQSSPLTVPAGTLLVYTFPASNYYSAVYKNQVSNILSDSVRLNDAQLAQIPDQKKVYFKYSATSGGDSSNEHIDVYTPYKDGFIHYLIVHTESQAINSDVWRISLAYITDGTFNDVTQLTTSGEWECAIHLPDRDDFSGGYAHGDEVLINDPTFYKDGLPITITDYTDFTECEEFTFVERTTMYDPADSTRGIAQHGSAHIFGKEKLKIQQSVLWLVDTALTNTYLAMLPIAKTVSHSFYTNARHIITAIGNTSHTESKATEAVVYGDDVSCKFSVPVYSPGSSYFFETDNGGTAYNKCYFAVAVKSVTHGDVWITETDYEFS